MIEFYSIDYYIQKIKSTSDYIDSQIVQYDRVTLSTNILTHIRTLAEYTARFIYLKENNLEYFDDIDKLNTLKKAKKYCSGISNYNYITKFIKLLSESANHENLFTEYAERVMLKYFGFLINLKLTLSNFHINIINNINKFPLDMDDSFEKYYRCIISTLYNKSTDKNDYNDTFYVKKKKLIYIDNSKMYEYVITRATDRNSKYDRFVAFSKLDIYSNYAIKANISYIEVNYLNCINKIAIINSYDIAIRPCEFSKLFNILYNAEVKFSKTNEYKSLMNYIKNNRISLCEISKLHDKEFEHFKNVIFKNESILYKTLLKLRSFIRSQKIGYKTLMYLSYRMNNDILKRQIPQHDIDSLIGINLKKGVYSFELNPFTSYLVEHVTKFSDLINIFDVEKYKGEILVRSIVKLSKDTSCIYLTNDTLNKENSIALIENYNKSINDVKYEDRKILHYNNYFYLSKNENNAIKLIRIIRNDYANNTDDYVHKLIISNLNGNNIDSEEKVNVLKNIFCKSRFYCIYGKAGSGKTYLAKLLCELCAKLNIVCVAKTNAVVNNIRHMINISNIKYVTLDKYIVSGENNNVDILIIDESSMVSNEDMLKVLTIKKPKHILAIGDIQQIPSIDLGNWFSIIKDFINTCMHVELNMQYRGNSNTLKILWDSVRDIKDNIQELLSRSETSHRFSDDIFERKCDDEIVLCLNYDGLYGINNINSILQENNPNKLFNWKNYRFKVNDPVLFNENNEYKEFLHNNLKGIITNIQEINTKFIFEMIVYTKFETEDFGLPFEIIEVLDDSKTKIRIEFDKSISDDYDNDCYKVFPFTISYAISIHKAQGLEYDSVKIVIANEVEEKITHNIFYTAITRAKQNLNIYWSPESEKTIISNFKKISYKNDSNILKNRYKDELESI